MVKKRWVCSERDNVQKLRSMWDDIIEHNRQLQTTLNENKAKWKNKEEEFRDVEGRMIDSDIPIINMEANMKDAAEKMQEADAK
jgi:hypothetical protein